MAKWPSSRVPLPHRRALLRRHSRYHQELEVRTFCPPSRELDLMPYSSQPSPLRPEFWKTGQPKPRGPALCDVSMGTHPVHALSFLAQFTKMEERKSCGAITDVKMTEPSNALLTSLIIAMQLIFTTRMFQHCREFQSFKLLDFSAQCLVLLTLMLQTQLLVPFHLRERDQRRTLSDERTKWQNTCDEPRGKGNWRKTYAKVRSDAL